MSAYQSATWNDEQLLELTRDDDRAAFTELYHRYWKRLFVVAANKLNDQAIAEELVQDILADLWYRRKQINITTTLSAYLSVALKYKIIDYMARLNHRLKYEAYAALNNSLEDDVTQDWLGFEELKDRLSKLVNALPEKCRIVYQLSREQGYSQKQIARKLGIAEKTVESHLAKALKNLRTKLSSFLFVFFF